MALNDREKLFADLYIELGNAYQAALQAGYKKTTAKDASKWINPEESLKKPNGKSKYKPEVREFIDARMAEKETKLIASQDEVLKYLTSVLRGESTSEEIVVEGIGDGMSEARTIDKAPSEKDRLKAAELLGKRYGLYTEKVDMDVNIPVMFSGEDDLED